MIMLPKSRSVIPRGSRQNPRFVSNKQFAKKTLSVGPPAVVSPGQDGIYGLYSLNLLGPTMVWVWTVLKSSRVEGFVPSAAMFRDRVLGK